MRRTQRLSARRDTGLIQSIHGYIIDLRCMPIRLGVDVTCDLLQVQSNETLMDICEEQRFEDTDVVMQDEKPRGCPDAVRERMTLPAHRHNLAAGAMSMQTCSHTVSQQVRAMYTACNAVET